jgi:hypothetical protein
MVRASIAIMAILSALVGLAVSVTILRGQGLDRAEKWTSLVGVFTSGIVGIVGLVLAWLTWRQAVASERGPAGRLRRTGKATATGVGSRAVSGSVGAGSGAVVEHTGDATAYSGGYAITGEDRSGSMP